MMKRNLLDAAVMTLPEALPGESKRMRDAGESDEHRQAVRAWLNAAKAKRSS
jgi:2-(1,2-epoxy-1,2-dihydrophenyl)acetyl-CoA isomerase